MNITVAGSNRTQDVGADLRARAAAMGTGDDHHRPAQLPDSISALTLAQARSEGDYLVRLNSLIRLREAIDTHEFRLPRRPGLTGWIKAKTRATIWKVMQFHRERMAFRQNLINTQLTSALVYETQQRQREIESLRGRLADLEKRLERRAP
jgi:hypothetical protein